MAEGRRPVIWSSDARSDLTEIWNYYVTVADPHTGKESCLKSGKRAVFSKIIRLPST